MSHSEGAPARSGQEANTAGRIISVVAGLISSALALHILFVVLEANQSNNFALFINDLAKNLSLGFDPLFTPENPKVGVLLNYGLAAVLYAGAGQLVSRLLRSR